MTTIQARLSLAVLTILLSVVSACSSGGQTPADESRGNTPASDPAPPHIVSISGAGSASISVEASDPNGDDITVSASAPDGISVSPVSQRISGGSGTVSFSFSAADLLSGGSGTASFEVSDGTSTPAPPRIVEVSAPPLEYAADTLYAIPLQTEAAVGEPVTILVATGHTAKPLVSLGTRIDAPDGWRFIKGSLNMGAPGGAKNAEDGAWAGLAAGVDILDFPEIFIYTPGDQATDPDSAGGDLEDGRRAYDIPVALWRSVDGVPESPADADALPAAKGALFNFQVSFDHPGTYDIGFVLRKGSAGVYRTFYLDKPAFNDAPFAGNFWSDSSNDYPGIPNTVTVH